MLQRSQSLFYVAAQCGEAVKDTEIRTGSLVFLKPSSVFLAAVNVVMTLHP